MLFIKFHLFGKLLSIIKFYLIPESFSENKRRLPFHKYLYQNP